jgi:hypothetical protein
MSKLAAILVTALLFSAAENANQPAPDPPETKEQEAMRQQLEAAFGKGCRELNAPITFEFPSLDLVISAREFRIGDDGRVRFGRSSVAQFSKADPTKINVIRDENITITFSSPITTVSDMRRHEIRQIETDAGRQFPLK